LILQGKFNASITNDTSGDVYEIFFSGLLEDVNFALKTVQFKPTCPFQSSTLSIDVLMQAQGYGGLPATGQLVSVEAGQAVEVKGMDIVTLTEQEVM